MRKKCKRKVWALVDPIEHALSGAAICSDDVLQPLRIRELSAIEAFRTGKAGLQEWSDICAMMNLCENMTLHGIGPEAKPTCDEAHGHLIEAAKRFENTGKMGITGPGIKCFRELHEWHDLQRSSISRSEYDRLIKDTVNRVKSGAPEVSDAI